jgi:hypothetical protein
MNNHIVVKRSDVPELVFLSFLSVAGKPVIAVQLDTRDSVEHPFASDGTFQGLAGSWKITYGSRSDGTLDVAICQDDIFRQSYRRLDGGQYQKRTDIVTEATRLDVEMDIMTIEGPSHGNPGDWLLVGTDDDLHFCDHETFTARYVPTSDL